MWFDARAKLAEIAGQPSATTATQAPAARPVSQLSQVSQPPEPRKPAFRSHHYGTAARRLAQCGGSLIALGVQHPTKDSRVPRLPTLYIWSRATPPATIGGTFRQIQNTSELVYPYSSKSRLNIS